MTLFKQTLTLRSMGRTAILLLFLSSMLVRCANTTTPQGGPRDTIPPVLMVAIIIYANKRYTSSWRQVGKFLLITLSVASLFFSTFALRRSLKLSISSS